MSTIITIEGDISASKADVNANFDALNVDKIETSVIDTDPTMAANDDAKLPSQKAVKALIEATASPVGKSWNEYASSGTGTDSYTISVPGITALVEGQTYKFKADVANTGACTLNVNGLGAKTIKKAVSVDLETGDIVVGQIIELFYDGTYMQSTFSTAKSIDVQTFTSSGTWTKPSGAKSVFIQAWGGGGSGGAHVSGAGGRAGHGGGGGGYIEYMFQASVLSATISVTVAGVAAGTTSNGNNGDNSTFGSYLTAYGGGAGAQDTGGTKWPGGGGSLMSAGQSGVVGFNSGFPGTPFASNGNTSGLALYGGGGGSEQTPTAGTSSFYAGAGGGGAGNGANPATAGGTSTYGGNGGDGNNSGNGVNGSPRGGGGGGSLNGTSGAGGRGEIIVTTFF